MGLALLGTNDIFHQRHKTVSKTELERGTKRLTQGRHDATWLAERAISCAKQKELSPIQRRAFSYLTEQADKLNSLSSSDRGMYDNLVIYAKFFNQFYFFGSLREDVRLELHPQEATKAKRLGESTVIPDGRGVTIRIQIFTRVQEQPNPQKRWKLYMGTLIHEMIHAYLLLYSCSYQDCSSTWEKCGEYDHGVAFLDMAKVLQMDLKERDIVDIEPNLESSLARELVLSNRTPEREFVDLWGLDWRFLCWEYLRMKREGIPR